MPVESKILIYFVAYFHGGLFFWGVGVGNLHFKIGWVYETS